MADAWMVAMAEVEDAVADQQVPTEEVATEPANSPRSMPVELPVQERPVFRQQPPPPPRAEPPHRTTQQWLHQ